MNCASICSLGVLMCKADLKLTTDLTRNLISTLWSSCRNCQRRDSAAEFLSILSRVSLYYCLKMISLNSRGLYSRPTFPMRKLPDLYTSGGFSYLLTLLASRSFMQPFHVCPRSHIFKLYISDE